MATTNLLKEDDDFKTLITELSALSGYTQNIIRECFEFMMLNWLIKVADNPDGFAELKVPYLGTIGVMYSGDRELPTGEITTDVETYVELSSNIKKAIGDIHDEGTTPILESLRKKIESAILVASA